MSEILPLALWKLFAKLLIIIIFFGEKVAVERKEFIYSCGQFIFLGAWQWYQHVSSHVHWAIVQRMSVQNICFQQSGNNVHKLMPVLCSLWQHPHFPVHSLASDQPENFLTYNICDPSQLEALLASLFPCVIQSSRSHCAIGPLLIHADFSLWALVGLL